MHLCEASGKEQVVPKSIHFKRFFKGHSHKRAEIEKNNRSFYFMDSDLFKKKPFVMHYHNVGIDDRNNSKVEMRLCGSSNFASSRNLPNSRSDLDF